MITLSLLPQIFLLPTLSYSQSSFRGKSKHHLLYKAFPDPQAQEITFPNPLWVLTALSYITMTGVIPASLSQWLPSFLSEDRLGLPLCMPRG